MSGDHNMYCAANQPTEKDKQAIKRKWVSLTDEEIRSAFHPLHDTGLQFARAIEKLLRSKNT
jgi:hypothetical protein